MSKIKFAHSKSSSGMYANDVSNHLHIDYAKCAQFCARFMQCAITDVVFLNNTRVGLVTS
jgi:hypothetical protein